MCAERMVSHLLPDDVWSLVWAKLKRPPGKLGAAADSDQRFRRWVDWSRRVVERYRKARNDLRYRQLVIAPEQLFRNIRNTEPGTVFIEQILELWATVEDRTRIALIPPVLETTGEAYGWKKFAADVAKILDSEGIFVG